MRKVLKWIGGIIAGILVVGAIAALAVHEPLPQGEAGPEADRLARQMLAATHKEAWDSTHYVRWTFPGGHHYVWDKFRQLVQVEWDDKKVVLRTFDQSGKAWEGGVEQQGVAAEKLLKKAWIFFCNDSFWLNAPSKAFDPGTSRSLVELEDGRKGLLVSYSGGGVTPGDAYLWELDEAGLPTSWKMWVSVLPIGGIEISWEEWVTLETGAKLATRHKVGFVTIEVENVRGGGSLAAIGIREGPFQLLD
ncbi:MAG: hypothetical protein KDD01_16865 [Phaeodactylibacter sp.]|nr:hypothetical protein [Phaeodactylibacter sp.]